MAYYSYNNDQPRRYDSYGYPRHAESSSNPPDGKLTAMASSVTQGAYSSSQYPSYGLHYEPRYATYAPSPQDAWRSSEQSAHRSSARKKHGWPPSPSVEDEKLSLAKEVASPAGEEQESNDSLGSRGSIDQYPIIQENDQYKPPPEYSDDRRFVLVSDPDAHVESERAARERRRKSFAERGNLPHLQTGSDDPPVFTERKPTPYAYTKPQKESLAPSADYSLSPEPVTPSASAVPRTVPNRDTWDTQPDQNSRPPKSIPIHTRYDSVAQSPRVEKNDAFEDSDCDDSAFLRTERKPARYSFVKSDLQKDDLRTNILNSQARADKKRPDETTYYTESRNDRHSGSSGSSKNPTPRTQSPRSSTSSLHHGASSRQKAQPAPTENLDSRRTPYPESRPSRPASPLRSSSPSYHDSMPSSPRSPKLPPRRPADAPIPSRPSSRGGPSRSASPLSANRPLTPSHVSVTEADWHATYPPVNRPRPPPHLHRHESLPVPTPRIDVQSPSSARKPKPDNPLPYPVDDNQAEMFMPAEEAYQFDHSYPSRTPNPTLKSPRSPYSDSPQTHSPIPGSPRDRPTASFPSPYVSGHYTAAPEELPPSPGIRTDSFRPQSSSNGRRTGRRTLSLDKPMPSCPRSQPSAKYSDWYTLENCSSFDICPSCYKGIFADTEFSEYFHPVRRNGEHSCHFSSPWMRLAWLLTIKQQRNSLDLIYMLAAITDANPPCPDNRENVEGLWYGFPDPRDGVHIANFSICECDLKKLVTLCPSIHGYMTPLPPPGHYTRHGYTCSLRTSSKRFPKYLDLLVELDEESQLTGRAPDMARFMKLARENAFKSECARDKLFTRRPWHYIPSLPEFTVCEECYDELVWPAIQQKNSVAKLFNRTTQLVPGEDALGTSCCLYSPRMRRIWGEVLEEEDYSRLKRKAIERKKAEKRWHRERAELMQWMQNMRISGSYRESDYDAVERDVRASDQKWRMLE